MILIQCFVSDDMIQFDQSWGILHPFSPFVLLLQFYSYNNILIIVQLLYSHVAYLLLFLARNLCFLFGNDKHFNLEHEGYKLSI
jgi:hypothetical protein